LNIDKKTEILNFRIRKKNERRKIEKIKLKVILVILEVVKVMDGSLFVHKFILKKY
jgi:hypothetical protein